MFETHAALLLEAGEFFRQRLPPEQEVIGEKPDVPAARPLLLVGIRGDVPALDPPPDAAVARLAVQGDGQVPAGCHHGGGLADRLRHVSGVVQYPPTVDYVELTAGRVKVENALLADLVVFLFPEFGQYGPGGGDRIQIQIDCQKARHARPESGKTMDAAAAADIQEAPACQRHLTHHVAQTCGGRFDLLNIYAPGIVFPIFSEFETHVGCRHSAAFSTISLLVRVGPWRGRAGSPKAA